MNQLTGAIDSMREFATNFGNYNSVVQTREEFTESLVNVLTEGADKLTLADMNEESANMLRSNQTTTSDKFIIAASQAQQGVLKLF